MSDLQLAPTTLNQAINPWTWWIKPSLGQMGFINIQETASGDPELERAIIEQAASYGRQLGRMSELLSVLVQRTNTDKWSESEKAVVQDFNAMAESVAATKRRRGRSPAQRVDSFLADLRRLEVDDPAEYDKTVARVCNALHVEPPGRPRTNGRQVRTGR